MSSKNTLTLGEGRTPLVEAPALSAELRMQVYLKCEGSNPTGSFKDRGMALAVGRAREAGAHTVICASTGNTAASAAAYAARAGLRAVVLTPEGATSSAKRAQARFAGAQVIEIAGGFDDTLRCCREVASEDGFVLVNSLNPDRLEGQKSVVREVLDDLGRAPDLVALPFGGGGNTCAVAEGLTERGIRAQIVAGQAAQRTSTFASAIRIGEPVHAESIAELVANHQVEVESLAEEEIRRAWVALAALEGVFCEPASAASVAALRRRGGVSGAVAVCIVTGHGLKDVTEIDEPAAVVVEPSADAVLEVLV